MWFSSVHELAGPQGLRTWRFTRRRAATVQRHACPCVSAYPPGPALPPRPDDSTLERGPALPRSASTCSTPRNASSQRHRADPPPALTRRPTAPVRTSVGGTRPRAPLNGPRCRTITMRSLPLFSQVLSDIDPRPVRDPSTTRVGRISRLPAPAACRRNPQPTSRAGGDLRRDPPLTARHRQPTCHLGLRCATAGFVNRRAVRSIRLNARGIRAHQLSPVAAHSLARRIGRGRSRLRPLPYPASMPVCLDQSSSTPFTGSPEVTTSMPSSGRRCPGGSLPAGYPEHLGWLQAH